MTMITAVRSQGPVPATTPAARHEAMSRTPAVQAARPVAQTDLKDAPGQPAATAASVAARLAERDESHHPAAQARAAADAAREAYIKASIAAGVSPLPLP
ncbi:MAG: hypothetical protein NTW20_14520 [Rhodobacterales bacterium]|nr:hypothetical protein [Rhodobacterales bacterium]